MFTTVLPDTISFFVGVTGQVQIAAIDVDLDPIFLVVDTGPALAFLVDNGDGTGVHVFTPDSTDVGQVIGVRFLAIDANFGVSDTLTTSYRVTDFLRGDLDGNFTYSMNDVVYLVSNIYRGGPDPSPIEAGDVDGNGFVNAGDVSYLINFLYRGGPRPPQ